MDIEISDDRLSNLPKDILVQILTLLPTKDLFRTTALSKTWRDMWTLVPHLEFENENDTLLDSVHRILNLHQVLLTSFQLSFSTMLPPVNIIDDWLMNLSLKNIATLVLKFPFNANAMRYRLPPCFFTQPQISTLVIRGCVLELPNDFDGFTNLRCLSLQNCNLNNYILYRLMSSTLPLETLSVDLFDGISPLDLCSMNFEEFNLYEESNEFDFTEFSPMLSFKSDSLPEDKILIELNKSETRTTCFLLYLMSVIPNVKKLAAANWFLKLIDKDDTMFPVELTHKFTRLHTLSLEIDLGSMFQVMTALFLFENSPNLETFEVHSSELAEHEVDFIADDTFWNHINTAGCNMNRLKVFKLHQMGRWNEEIAMLQFILSKAPILESVTIVCRDNGQLGLLEIVDLECVSPVCTISSGLSGE